ncbi:MAG: EAL domain-containing protein [Myxococcales bacterium]|nr:EAL domain-containing protein [Myxococcales bacterium]
MTENPLEHKRPLILVVDDDPGIRMVARSLFEQEGMRVVEAQHGVEALASLERTTPDLICLDVRMPGLDGFSVCEKIREKPSTQHTPVLMMTGLEDVESIHRGYEVGATDFVTKPVNWPIVAHRVRYVLRASERAQELWRSQQRLADAQRIARIGNWELDLATGSIQCWGELAAVFRIESGRCVDAAVTLLEKIHGDDRAPLLECLKRCRDEGRPASTECRVAAPHGETRTFETEVHPVFDDGGEIVGLKGTSQDVSRRKRVEREIRHLAFHDGLTGLPNRRLFRELALQAIRQAWRDARKLAVLYLDLDDFKRINDTLGHSMGDQLLERVSERLDGSTRRADTVARPQGKERQLSIARLGGDEFVVLLSQIKRTQDIANVAQRILEELAQPFVLGDHEVVVGASIGISVCPDDSEDVETLLRNADMAMYRAKAAGKNRYKFYTEAMNATAFRRLQLESQLRKAVDAERLQIYYQPKISMSTGRITGVEALLRWNDPDLGVVAPDEFIPLAEETGLISGIGEWIIDRACAQAKQWVERELGADTVAINISGIQFRDRHLVASVRRALAEHDLDASHLEVEITESTLMRDETRVVSVLQELRGLGIRVSIDDFGTGYSSLRYLREFPVDQVKIDRSFLRGVGTETAADDLVAAILSMCKALHLNTVAEGVETEAQLTFLRDHGCDEYQGYFFSPPLAPDDLEPLLKRAQAASG